MSRQAPPIVANTDFQQWQSWQPVSTPDGNSTYYVVPGYNGQYVFDPYESDATGSIMIYRNPQAVYDRAEEERKAAEDATSITAQFAPVAGTAAGALGAGYVADLVKNWDSAAGIAGNLFGTSAAPAAAGSAGASTGSALASPQVLGIYREGSTALGSAAGTIPTETGGMFGNLGGSIGKALPYLGAAAGAYGFYDLLSNADYKGDYGRRGLQGAASGAAIGSVVPVVGTVIGGLLGGAAGLIAGFAGSGKSRHQVARDEWRRQFQENGLLDEDFQFTLADGRKYDLGRDGGGWNIKGSDGKTYKGAFEVDFTDPRAGYAAGAVNPLMDILTQGGYSNGEVEAAATPAASFINMLADGAQDVQYVNQNARNLYEKMGLNQESMFQAINQLAESGKISKEQQLAYHNAVNVAYGVEYGTGNAIDQSDVPDFEEMTAIASSADEEGNLPPEAQQEIVMRQPYYVDPQEVEQAAARQVASQEGAEEDERARQLAAMMDNRTQLGEQRARYNFSG